MSKALKTSSCSDLFRHTVYKVYNKIFVKLNPGPIWTDTNVGLLFCRKNRWRDASLPMVSQCICPHQPFIASNVKYVPNTNPVALAKEKLLYVKVNNWIIQQVPETIPFALKFVKEKWNTIVRTFLSSYARSFQLSLKFPLSYN